MVTKPIFVFDWQVKIFLKSKTEWLQKKQAEIKKKNSDLKTLEGSYDSNKARARLKITDTVKKVNQHYGLKYNRIAIRDTKTRWGSCSDKKNLNFSYKLYLLPEELCVYVVTHELVHLQEMNHSKNFWSLVAETVPDYKQHRKELRKYML